jgi:hypothetical protein
MPEPLNDARVRALLRAAAPENGGHAVLDRVRGTVLGRPELLAAAGRLDEGAATRVLARVRATVRAVTGRAYAPWAVPAAALALLMAGLFAMTWPHPLDRGPVVGAVGRAEPVRGFVIDAEAPYEVRGSSRAPLVSLPAGAASFDVDPARGLAVSVTSPAGTVHVLGTAFRVDVGDTRMEVSVERGHVRVDCAVGGSTDLRAGARHACPMPTPPALLLFATGRSVLGAPPSDVLRFVDAGLRLSASGPVATELRFLRFQSLLRDGRRGDAREELGRYLADAEAPRRVDALRAQAQLALLDVGCAAALPALRELAAASALDEGGTAALAACDPR